MSFWKRLLGRGSDSSDEALPPAKEAAIARKALADGDFKHAACHAGRAIAAPPYSAEYVKLLDEILASVSTPQDLAPESDGNYVSTILVRARAMLMKGRIEDATILLVNVLAYDPQCPYLSWVLDRLEREPEKAGEIEPQRIASLVANLLDRIRVLAAFAPLSVLFETIERARPCNPAFLRVAVSVHSRADRHDLAIRAGQASFEAEPSWNSATTVGRAMRGAGRIDDAERAFLEAHKLDPSDESVFLDLGDMMLEAGRLDASRSYFERALAAAPGHPWATAGRDVLHQLGEPGDPRSRLETLAREAGDEERADAVQQLSRMAKFICYLPTPPDLVLKAVEEAWDRLEPGDTLQVTLDFPEAASLTLVIDAIRRRVGAECVVVLEGTPQLDPRKARKPLEVALWQFVDGRAQPAIPPPTTSAVEPVIALARERFNVETWWSTAQRAGADIGPDSAAEMLRLMVHPPEAPDGWFEGHWIFSIQAASAFSLAHVDKGWEGSTRRRLLLDVLRGPMDWTVGAASMALARIAREDPTASGEIESELRALAQHASAFKFCSYAPALKAAAGWLPTRSTALESALASLRC
jgi:tetratricopeptide (TPR) repeat protein